MINIDFNKKSYVSDRNSFYKKIIIYNILDVLYAN